MECLNCDTSFESENKRRLFCSGRCKVAYHRKNVKKSEVTKFDLKVLYNEILALAQKIGSEQPKVYDSPKVNTTFRDEPKQWQEPEVDNLQVWKNQINDCDNIDEINYAGQQIASSGLTRQQQNALNNYAKSICEKKRFL